MPNLTKRDFVLQTSRETGITQQEVFAGVELTLDGITDALAAGNGVELGNFSVFGDHIPGHRRPQELSTCKQ